MIEYVFTKKTKVRDDRYDCGCNMFGENCNMGTIIGVVENSYSGVLVIALGNVFLVERSGRGDYVKEWGDPCTERLPERGTTREKGSKADPTAAGDSETERAE